MKSISISKTLTNPNPCFVHPKGNSGLIPVHKAKDWVFYL